MTNNDELALKLKAAAEKAIWGDWEDYKPHKGARGYEVKKGITAVAQHCLKDDAAYIAKANPKFILSLLAERDADKAENKKLRGWVADLEQKLSMANDRMLSWQNDALEAKKRIAELEARTVSVKLPCDYYNEDGSVCKSMTNTCEIVSAFRDGLRRAGIKLDVGE
ncbi:hypothetical protein BKC65_02170 [Salmonella enterica subsp. enterica serovar Agona]|nr:hypothetical protein [Salmonella enterica subsp. enterica serovar Agona]